MGVQLKHLGQQTWNNFSHNVHRAKETLLHPSPLTFLQWEITLSPLPTHALLAWEITLCPPLTHALFAFKVSRAPNSLRSADVHLRQTAVAHYNLHPLPTERERYVPRETFAR